MPSRLERPNIAQSRELHFRYPSIQAGVEVEWGIAHVYVEFVILTTEGRKNLRDEMRRRAKGSAGTMPKISQKILAELKVPYCKPDVQRRITQQIDTLNSHASAFEADIEIQLAKSNALRQSILKQAFSGRLVAQDAKDEPASVLLARIRQNVTARPRRTTTAR